MWVWVWGPRHEKCDWGDHKFRLNFKGIRQEYGDYMYEKEEVSK